MAFWWAIGCTITGLLTWAFMSNYSCTPDATPLTFTRADNMSWRYLHFTCDSLVLIMAISRLTIIKITQTPRWLLSQNRNEELIKVLDGIAMKYNRTHHLTLENYKLKELFFIQKDLFGLLYVLRCISKVSFKHENLDGQQFSSLPIGSLLAWLLNCMAYSYHSIFNLEEQMLEMIQIIRLGETTLSIKLLVYLVHQLQHFW